MKIEYSFVTKLSPLSNPEVVRVRELLQQLAPDLKLGPTAVQLAAVAFNGRLLIARDRDSPPSHAGHRIVGMAVLVPVVIPTGNFARIEDVVVDTAYRGQGVGRELVQRLITEARELNFKRIDLTSHPTREAANKLYESLNFKKLGTNLFRLQL